jgi:O-acetylhomoserine (thiol)-lyase
MSATVQTPVRVPDLLGTIEAPVFQTAAFTYASAEDMADVFAGRAPGHLYTRLGNPTTLTLERRLAEAEGGVGCIATSSGMAAIAAVMTGLLRPGDEILSASGIFGGTVSLFRNLLGRFGVRTTLANAADSAAFARAISPATRVLFVETIANPGMDVPDLAALADVAHQHGIPLVVDSTVTTPALVRPGDFNADIVVHSTSKFINGQGSAIGGAIVDTGRFDWAHGPFADVATLARKSGRLAFLAHLRATIARDLGGCPAPWTSFLVLQGLDTLAPRMRAHCANALRLAEELQSHPAVRRVNYPGLQSSPYYTRVRRFFGGMGGAILTIELETQKRAFRFINALHSARLAANLGETRTLDIHPASTIFREYDPDDRQRMGVPDDLVRICVGIEDSETIVEDMRQALDGSMDRDDIT